MRFLTGDECGLLKEFVPEIAHRKLAKEQNSSEKPDIVLPVHYDNIQKVNTKYGIQRVDPNENQTRARGAVDMTFLRTTENSMNHEDSTAFSFAALRQNGCVEVWQGGQTPDDTSSRKSKFAQYQRLSLSGDVFEATKQESLISNVPVKPLGLAEIGGTANQRLLAADTHGTMVILKASFDNNSDKPVSILKHFSAFSNSPDNITLTYTKGKIINTQLASAMAMNPNASQAAIGGRERDIRLIDLETCQPLWKAKNLPPDPQTLLQQPIWPSAMVFVQDDANSSSNLLAVGTGFGQVRLYDVRSQPAASIIRRPIRYTPEASKFLEHRITAICQTNTHQVVVGDTTGDLHALDLRYNLNGQHGNKQIDGNSSLGRYAGPAGSIRQMVKHPTLPIMAVVGCDRMLRTYNTQTQKIVDCVYLKQRLNCVLACPEGQTEGFDEDEVVGADAGGTTAGDIDQDDLVEDYVNSSDEDNDKDEENDSESDNGGNQPQQNGNGDNAMASESDDADSDGSSPDEGENIAQENDSVSGSESESASDDSEEDSAQEEQAPNKRRRR